MANPTFEVDGFHLDFRLMWVKEDTPFLGKVVKGVVLLIPVYNLSERCHSLLFRALHRLNPLPEKVIFATNNNTDNTLELLDKYQLPHEVIEFDREDVQVVGRWDILAYARQILLDRARNMDAKLAIYLDDDCIPERKDFIQMYMDNNFGVCCGAYIFADHDRICAFWGLDSNPKDMPIQLTKADFQDAYRQGIAKNRLESQISFNYSAFVNDKSHPDSIYLIETAGGGALALGQAALNESRLNFYPIYGFPDGTSEDTSFYWNANALGYNVYLDFKIRFHHLETVCFGKVKSRSWLRT
ncbi:MAG: glycosyltransferase family A protein [Candidatus Bathyarchaeia archaeon]|jgi:hypothetical protein